MRPDTGTTTRTTTGSATGTAPATRGDAAIHDIGYRGYQGPRLGRGQARRALFEHSLRGAYGLGRSARSKVLPFALFAVTLLPAVVIVALAIATDLDELPFAYSEYPLLMHAVIGLYIALAAPQMVSLDLRYHTTPLYFSRPLERGDYVLAKLGALTAALFLFMAVPLLLMYAGALLGKLDFADQTAGFARGLVGAAVYAALHAAVALLVSSLTPRRGFGVAAVIAVFTVPFFAAVALQDIAAQQGDEGLVAWIGLFSPATLIDGMQAVFLAGSSQFTANAIEPDTPTGVVYLLVIAGLIALCGSLLLRRYRKAGI